MYPLICKGFFSSFGSGKRASPSRSRAARLAEAAPPIVPEALEARRHLSVTVTHNTTTNTLTITGDANANVITVYQQNSHPTQQVFVVADNVLYGGFNVNADLTLIVVNAGDGIDDVRFSSEAAGDLAPSFGVMVSVPAQIHGNYDSDVLYGTDQADTIWGDFGNDEIRGAAGNDTLYGGYGDGTESGNDSLWGGSGSDSMYGEGGNDLFHAGGDSAADYLDGGSGSSDNAVDRDAGTDTTVNIEILT